MNQILTTGHPEKNRIKFITYNNTQDGRIHDPQTRQVVRRQARLASRWPPELKTSPNATLRPAATEPRSLQDSQGRFRLSKNRPQPLKTPADADIRAFLSPFAPTIRALGNDAPLLLNYYCHVFQSKCVAIDFESDWLDFILSNRATSHALLALVALSYDAHIVDTFSFRSTRHNDAAVRLVRQQLSDGCSLPTDTVICAVALLTVSESIQDDETSSTAHFRGLDEMIRLRGGNYDAFAHCRTLQKIMSWARRIYCLRSNQPWNLPAVPSSSRAAFDFLGEDVDCRRDLHSDTIKRNTYTNVISPELERLLDSLHVLSSFPPAHSWTSAHRQQISHIIYNTEYNLILLNQSQLENVPRLSGRQATLSRSYQIAVQIYLMVALRRLVPGSALVQRYVKVLRSDTRSRQLPSQDLDSTSYRSWAVLLLWIETILAVATIGREETLKSAVILKALLKFTNCFDLEGYMTLLKEVCWLDGYLEDRVSDVWTETKQ